MIASIPADYDILYFAYCFRPLLQIIIFSLLMMYSLWYLRLVLEIIIGQPITTSLKPIVATPQVNQTTQRNFDENNIQFVHNLWPLSIR
ncbi:2796_t:CDS:2 [Funneliformis geosporum]|uniref:16474_t:CDS:1 n=1 Tax=Funneliformis geosporum TaxID=1117311 RepID=A0A9W4T243_9GLOM|nr:16474_t:CDS:2 [Funneliformis geosporum]CAI2190193.1 2796_t:CDS:2 [Funneliformis geosporum]